MKGKKTSNIAGAILCAITLAFAAITAWEIMNYVQLRQDISRNAASEQYDYEANSAIEVIQNNEFHNSILTLICSTLLSISIDVAYFSILRKK